MGLFGSKIYVASTVKNMAGKPEDRPDYLKTIVASNVLLSGREPMAQVIRDGYLYGPGTNTRSFYRWAKRDTNYDQIGMPTASFTHTTELSGSVVKAHIEATVTAGDPVRIVRLERSLGDFSYWASAYMLANHPTLINTDWTADHVEATGEIKIVFEDSTFELFTPVDFDVTAEYLYAVYSIISSETDGIFIYRRNTGAPLLDDAFEDVGDPDTDGYYPYIPIRVENEFLSDTYYPDAYQQAKRAYRKLTGQKMSAIRDLLADLESLDDVDHAYVSLGPAINVIDKDSRNYIFEYFEKIVGQLEDQGKDGTAAYDAWEAQVDAEELSQAEYEAAYAEWQSAQSNPTHPQYGEPAPINGTENRSLMPASSIRIRDTNAIPGGMDIEIMWAAMSRTSGAGLAKPDAKLRDVWFEETSSRTVMSTLMSDASDTGVTIKGHRIYRQTTLDAWDAIDFIDLKHRNIIYRGKYVQVTLADALEDPEESGFVVPLHHGIFKSMSLIRSTQLATACTNVVLNSYVVKKFSLLGFVLKIVLIIVVVIVLNMVFPGLGNTIGGKLAVALGLTGFVALIVAIAVNFIAGMIVQAILTKAATAVFGEKFGAIIGALATVFAMSGLNSLANGGGFTANFSSMFSAQGLLSLTQAVGNAYASVIQMGTAEIQAKQADYVKTANVEMLRVQELYAVEIGYGNAAFDPLNLVSTFAPVVETPDTFLTRTLMVGSDICELTHAAVSNFSAFTTTKLLPI